MADIVETSDNKFFKVRPATSPGLDHCWIGIPVRQVRGEWIERKRGPKSHWRLVRKAGCRIVQAIAN